jgi:hypothetical protein
MLRMTIWILSETRLQRMRRRLHTGNSKNTFHNILDAFSETRSGKVETERTCRNVLYKHLMWNH